MNNYRVFVSSRSFSSNNFLRKNYYLFILYQNLMKLEKN